MKKKWKIIFGVIYYCFTFSLGIMIALVLPTVNRDIIMYEYLDNYIENGEYVKAVDLLGGIYNKECILEDSEKNIVIFETTSLLEIKEKKDEVETKKTIINGSYICIVTNLQREWFEIENEDNNLSKVLINGNQKIDILQHDLDEDGKLDTIATLIDSNYICFSIDHANFNEVKSIELINAKGDSLVNVTNLELNFGSDFFDKTKEFVTKYNLAYEDNKFTKEENEELKQIYDKVIDENPNYQNSGTYSMEEINKEANRDSVSFILIYFIWIYILGDCLVGPRYIFRFIKFIYSKIKKKDDSKENQLALGNNFYSSVTFELENKDEYDGDIILSYEHEKNRDYNFKVIINKSTEYKTKERIHGGIYKLTNIECQEYKVIDLPERLDVKGYTMNIIFKIKKEN